MSLLHQYESEQQRCVIDYASKKLPPSTQIWFTQRSFEDVGPLHLKWHTLKDAFCISHVKSEAEIREDIYKFIDDFADKIKVAQGETRKKVKR